MSDNVEYRYTGPGLASMLFLVFLVLKLTGVIDWSWWWVTAPLWIACGLWIVIVGLVLGGVALVAGGLFAHKRWKWRKNRKW